MRRRLAILVVLFFGFGCSTGIAQISTSEATALSEKPNILFVLTDDQDPATLAHMRNVKVLLKDKGRTFTNTVNTNPLCCPARATMQRGQYSHNTGILRNGDGYTGFERMGLHNSTMATWLDGADYRTGYFGKYMNGYNGQVIPGWDEIVALGEPGYTDKHETDPVAARNAMAFLQDASAGEEPFLAFVSFWAPHAPYVHPKTLDDEFTRVKAPKRGALLTKKTYPTSPPTSEGSRG